MSHFAGAAQELTEALIVNPYDVDGVAETLDRALRLSAVEQRARMREMRLQVATHSVYDWASDLLADARGLRRQEHMPAALVPDVASPCMPIMAPSENISHGTLARS